MHSRYILPLRGLQHIMSLTLAVIRVQRCFKWKNLLTLNI